MHNKDMNFGSQFYRKKDVTFTFIELKPCAGTGEQFNLN